MHVCHTYLIDIVYNIERSATHNVVFFIWGDGIVTELSLKLGGIVTGGIMSGGHSDRGQDVRDFLKRPELWR